MISLQQLGRSFNNNSGVAPDGGSVDWTGQFLVVVLHDCFAGRRALAQA
jgi:hypothetical protein